MHNLPRFYLAAVVLLVSSLLVGSGLLLLRQSQPVPVSITGTPIEAPQLKIKLNEADADELEQLPGIGPTFARRIIDHRTEHGPFTSLNELRNVQGVSALTVEKLKDHVTL